MKTFVIPVRASLIAVLALFPQAFAAALPENRPGFQEHDVAVMRLPSPKRFALVRHATEPAPRLYKVGDVIFYSGGTPRALTIDQIDEKTIMLHESRTGQRLAVSVDERLPGVPGLILRATVVLTEIRYRFEPVHRVAREAPIVLSLAGSKAVFQQQVRTVLEHRLSDHAIGSGPDVTGESGSQPVSALSPRILDEHTYELEKASLTSKIRALSRAAARLLPGIARALTSGGGVLPLSTTVGDGVLTETGFTVTQPKVAHSLGIEVGDTILNVNGRPVSSPLNAWWTFQEVFIRDRTPELRVDLVRAGAPLTKTYRLK